MKRKRVIAIIVCIVIITFIVFTGIFANIKSSRNYLQEVSEITIVDVTGLIIGEETEHKHIIETKYDETNHFEECIICGKRENIINHTYVDNSWTMGTSCSENNVHKYSCVCGYSYTNTVGRPSHNLKTKNFSASFVQVAECENWCGYIKSNHECHKADESRISCTNLGRCNICNFNYTVSNSYHEVVKTDLETSEKAICKNCNITLGKVDYCKVVKLSNNSYKFQASVTMDNGNIFNNFGNYNQFGGKYTISNEKNNTSGTTWTFERTVTFNEYREKGGYFQTNIGGKVSSGLKTSIIIRANVGYLDSEVPVISSIKVEEDSTDVSEWSQNKTIKVEGTENYCKSVKVKIVNENEEIVAEGETSVTNQVYSIIFTPNIEADELGKTFKVIVTDACENSTEQEFTISKVDRVAPEPISGTEVIGEWSKSKEFTFEATDYGIGNVSIAFNDVEDYALANKSENTYTRDYKFVGDVYEPKEAKVFYKDELGNVGIQTITIDKIDNTAPTITSLDKTLNIGEDYATVDVTANANDINLELGLSGSGVSHYAITNTNIKPDENSEIWQEDNNFSITEDGTYYIWAKDFAGNISEPIEIVETELSAKYMVKHYLMNVDGNEYILDKTEEFSGKKREEVTPNTEKYTGFSVPDEKTVRIEEDGSTVVEYYYIRNKYRVTLDSDDGVYNIIGAGEYFYEESVMIDADIKSGYVWNGWTGNENVISKQYNINMPAENIEYNANTLRVSKVITKYIDLNNGEEIEKVEKEYIEGNNYETEEKVYVGYQIVDKTENTTGKVGREDIEVVYYYKKLSEGVEVRYIDEVTGEEIEDTEIIEGLEKDKYEVEEKKITGYELVNSPTNKAGEMTVEKITVIYKYRKVSKVTVKYIDENSKEEIEKLEKEYKEGEEYTTEEKEYEGYRLVNKTNNTSGEVEKTDIEVKYYYKKISGGVEVRYINQVTGEEIEDTEIIEGLEKDKYEAEEKEMEGYELVNSPTNKAGEMTVEKIIVTYEYRRKGKVIVKYIDKEKDEIIKEEIIEGIEGDKYKVEREELEKYNYIETVGEEEGEIIVEEKEVKYYYTKKEAIVEVVYVDEKGNEIYKEIIEGKVGEKYRVEENVPKNYKIKEEAKNKEGIFEVEEIKVKYIVERIKSSIVINIVDENGKVIEKIEKEGNSGETYEIELPKIEGYYTEKEKIEIECGKEEVINVEYKKIIDPDTSDMNIYYYILIFIGSAIIFSVLSYLKSVRLDKK